MIGYGVIFVLGVIVASWPCMRLGYHLGHSDGHVAGWNAARAVHLAFIESAEQQMRSLGTWLDEIARNLPGTWVTAEVRERIEWLRNFGRSS